MRAVLAFLASLIAATTAWGQSSPGWPTGKVPTAAEWAAAFSGKMDYHGFPALTSSSLLGATPIVVSSGGGVVNITCPTCTTTGGSGAVNITAYGATCSTGAGPDNAVAIQNAINATPTGGTLYIPACPNSTPVYNVIGSGSCIFTRTLPINIVGDGRTGSIISIGATVPNTRDVFCMNPLSTTFGWGFSDFSVTQAGGVGSAARHVIYFNVPLGSFAFNSSIRRMTIAGTAGGNSIRVVNDPSTTSGGIAYSRIAESNLESIYFDTVGDGLNVEDNVIGAAGANIGVRVSFVAGAGGFFLHNNVITALSCIVCIVNGNGVVLSQNYLETPAGQTNTYGFVMDINTGGGTMLSPQLVGNQISVITGTGNPIPVRIRTGVDNARLADKHYVNATGTHVQVDSGAANTRFDRNTECLTNNIVVACSVSDSGTTSGWVNWIANGTVSAPSIGFLSATNTGIFLDSAKLAIAVTGTEIGTFSSAGLQLITGGVVGGTGAGSSLALQATSGVGVGAEFVDILGGNNGGQRLGRFTNTINGQASGLSIGTTATAVNGIQLAATAVNSLKGNIAIDRTVTAATAGTDLSLTAGAAVSGGTDIAGGNVIISSGIGTGASGSNIQFNISPAATSGTSDNAVVQALILNNNGGRFISTVAPPSGGSTGVGIKISSTSNLGIFFGSGAPTLSAAQGSIYIRTEGTQNNRLYINTNGSTGWTAFNTTS